MFSEEAVFLIARGIGVPLPPQKPILDFSRIGEAKLKVEVLLSDNLPPEIMASDEQGNGVRVKATNPNLPFKCSRCHRFGHASRRCYQPPPTTKHRSKAAIVTDPSLGTPIFPPASSPPASTQATTSHPPPSSTTDEPSTVHPPFGPLSLIGPSPSRPALPQSTVSAQSLLASFIWPFCHPGPLPHALLPTSLSPQASVESPTSLSAPSPSLPLPSPAASVTSPLPPPPNLLHLIPFSPPPLQIVSAEAGSISAASLTAKKLMKSRGAPAHSGPESSINPSINQSKRISSGTGGIAPSSVSDRGGL